MTDEDWAKAAPDLEAALACARGTHTVEDLKAMHAAGAITLWRGEKSIVVTQANLYPRLKALHIWLAAGDLKEIAALRVGIEAIARGQGFDRVTASAEAGRRGWLKFSEPAGFEPAWETYVKDLRA